MAVIPFAAAKCSIKSVHITGTSTADIAKKSKKSDEKLTDSSADNKTEILSGLVAAYYDEEYSEETLKAIAVILNTNYKTDRNSFNLNDSKVFISKEKADKSLKDGYDKIEKAVISSKELYLQNNNKLLFIPCCTCSNGSTVDSKKYDYIKSIASPWDCYSKNYNENNICEGVSIDGIDYLCKNGASVQEALKWYLPDFDVKKL